MYCFYYTLKKLRVIQRGLKKMSELEFEELNNGQNVFHFVLDKFL